MEQKDISRILETCDHTLLAVTATWEDIKVICDDGMRYHTASVCIPPCYVKQAKEYVEENLKICTVIGFPNGYMTTAAKLFETEDAVKNGADEIDMVINIGRLKNEQYEEIEKEICQIRKACKGKILKVIIETCLLTDDEIQKMCEIVVKCGADFIKTSTGFSKEGATFHAVEVMKRNVYDKVKVKAAGGITSLEDAKRFLELGADRLGTSKVVKIVKEQQLLQ